MSKNKELRVIFVITFVSTTMMASSVLLQQPQPALGNIPPYSNILKAPIFTSGSNFYFAWSNNDTGHWGVFFAKSVDGGKTLSKTIMLSDPNNGNVVDFNVDIAASGHNVVVTWWTNTTGLLMPVFKSSSDTGDSFGNEIILNSSIS